MKYSEKQKRIINDILDDSKTKRKRILGASGTGKSLIIAYCAKILAQQDKKILICFYNKSLIPKFESLCHDSMNSYGRLPRIINYHKYMFDYVRSHSPNSIDDFKRDEFGADGPKDGYRLRAGTGEKLFDYIFVDEMQDMTINAISNLIDLLKDTGKICIFADKNQKLYEFNEYETEENTDNQVPKLPANAGFRGPWNRLDEIFRANNTIQKNGR